MLRGLSTVSFYAEDVTAAADWYGRLLGTEPYFTREMNGTLAYAEFRVGDYAHELGIIDRRFAPAGHDCHERSARTRHRERPKIRCRGNAALGQDTD